MSFVSSVSGECVLKCDPLTVTERNPQTKWLFISFWCFGHTRLLGQIIMLKSWIFKTVLPRCELWPLLPSVAETTQPTYGKSPTFVNLYRQKRILGFVDLSKLKCTRKSCPLFTYIFQSVKLFSHHRLKFCFLCIQHFSQRPILLLGCHSNNYE